MQRQAAEVALNPAISASPSPSAAAAAAAAGPRSGQDDELYDF